MKPVRLILGGVATAVMVLGAGSAPALAASSHAAAIPATRRPAPRVVAHRFRLARHAHLPRTHLPKPRPANGSTLYSANWAGYADSATGGTQFRYVAAQFTMPTVYCPRSPAGSSGYAYSSHWVGLDGFSDSTVEQTGVAGYCNSAGTPGYYAWYEMYPQGPVAYTGVSPGDTVQVSVFYNASTTGYNLFLKDVTTGGYLLVTDYCPSGSTCLNSSAEVISEDPGGAVANGYNLADFGQANYENTIVTTVSGHHGSFWGSQDWGANELIMNDGTNTLATPSVRYGGKAFSVDWRAAS